MVELTKTGQIGSISSYSIFIDRVYAGGLDLIIDSDKIFIENIMKSSSYSGHGLLKQVVEFLSSKGYGLSCLPLPKYKNYYKTLGFKPKKNSIYELKN